MRTHQSVWIVIALLIMQPAFAHSSSENKNDVSIKQCDTIVKACLKAGYSRKGKDGKTFWEDCMKPVLLNKPVKKVTVNTNDVSACRQAKISKMQSELEELQKVK